MLIKILIRGKIEGVYTRRGLLKRGGGGANYNPGIIFLKAKYICIHITLDVKQKEK